MNFWSLPNSALPLSLPGLLFPGLVSLSLCVPFPPLHLISVLSVSLFPYISVQLLGLQICLLGPGGGGWGGSVTPLGSYLTHEASGLDEQGEAREAFLNGSDGHKRKEEFFI